MRHSCTSWLKAAATAAVIHGTTLPAALAQTTVAGFTPGSFAVNETGAATYSIPIAVPPGTAGMEPRLALSYNSQTGNGLLGMGWSISGFSAIGRCPRTLAQDGVSGAVNYDANDRFCLDGRRLVAVSASYGADGTEYRTERESFARVISYGTAGEGPAWFKVWTKSGQIIEYGNTTDSRVEAQGKSTVRVWAVSRISDTAGNYMSFGYVEENGDYRPESIAYTGNTGGSSPTASVQFSYETRPDAEITWQSGSVINRVKRLTAVRTYAGAQLVRSYTIAYGLGAVSQRSRLSTVTECNASGQCFAPATFAWQDEATTGNEAVTWTNMLASNGAYYDANWATRNQAWVDVNGDGKADWCRSTGSGAGSGNDSVICVTNLGTGGNEQVVVTNILASNGTYHEANWATRNQAWVDVNGDGKVDWCRSVGNGAGSGNDKIFCVVNLGTGGDEQVVITDILASNGTYQEANWATRRQAWVDVDGDGRTDWCRSAGNGAGSGNDSIICTVNLGTGGNEQVVITNMLASNGNYYDADWVTRKQAWVDVNGDGKVDWCRSTGSGAGSGNDSIVCVINIGSGGDEQAVITNMLASNGGYYDANWATRNQAWVDVNGDGKTDWCRAAGNGAGSGNDRIICVTNLGRGGNEEIIITDALASNGGYYNADWASRHQAWVDVNGDGKADWCRATGNGAGSGNDSIGCTPVLSGPRGDLLLGITESSGRSVAIVHKPITDETVYSKAGDAAYPVQDLQVPLHVVYSATLSQGAAGNNTKNYFYTGAKAQLQGGGFLGFRKLRATDAGTGIKIETTLRTDYPFHGLPTLAQKMQSDGTLVSSTENTWTDTSYANSTGKHHKSELTQSVERSYELNGSLMVSAITSTSYDGYGNATQISVSTGDGYSKLITNTYSNDTGNWFLGRLTRTSVASTAPDAPALPPGGGGGPEGDPPGPGSPPDPAVLMAVLHYLLDD